MGELNREEDIEDPARQRNALQVIRAAIALSGDVEKALSWYHNEPLQPFEYKTAEQLVSEGKTDDLVSYIASLEAGGVS